MYVVTATEAYNIAKTFRKGEPIISASESKDNFYFVTETQDPDFGKINAVVLVTKNEGEAYNYDSWYDDLIGTSPEKTIIDLEKLGL